VGRVRIVDVARRAGVSSATVSRVLANKPYVRPELRQRVLAAAQELGYRPSRVARTLRTQRARIIGLLISDIENPFFTSLVRAVEDVAYAHDYAVFLCNTDENPEKEQLYLDLMVAERVTGVLISPTREQGVDCQGLQQAQIPLVAVDRRLRDRRVDTVVVDNVGGARRLVEHLLDDGYREIGAILPPPTITSGRERYQGLWEALHHRGLEPRSAWIRTGPPVQAEGYRLAREILGRHPRPQALFVGNNLLTMGALRAIRDLGLSIPGDVALVAFDDMDWMALVNPGLTVMAQPTYELGRAAAELLLRRLEDPDRPVEEVLLTPELRIRQSCAPHLGAGRPRGEVRASGQG